MVKVDSNAGKEFRTFYTELTHQMKNSGGNIADPHGKIAAEVADTFKALAQNGSEERVIYFGGDGHQVSRSDLGEKELKIFAKFAKIYFSSHAVDEKKADFLIDNMAQIPGFEKVKRQILFHENFKDEGTTTKPIQIETTARILDLINTEQIKVINKEKEIKKDQNIDKRNLAISVGACVLGAGLLAGGIAMVVIAGPAALGLIIGGSVLVPVGGTVLLVGAGGALFSGLDLSKHRNDSEIAASAGNLERLASYKKIIQDEEFLQFAEKNKFANPKDMDEQILYKYLNLYKDEKKLIELQSLNSDRSQIEILSASIEEQRERLTNV